MSHDDEIRKETARLAQIKLDGPAAFARRGQKVSRKRLAWWDANRERLTQPDWERLPLLDRAYRIFYLEYLGLDPEEVPIVERSASRLVVRSANFCPVHAACEALGLDTREVCRAIYEQPVTDLLRQIDPRLRFSRNYEAIRPYAAYCEEMIEMAGGGEG
ncbi:MAG: hypothetical protein V3W14_06680 [Candidatus Neomarinimicrobiota bacterium]